MAFNWQQDVSQGASIDAADVNEIKNNLDSIYTYLGITRSGCSSGAGWTKLPVSPGDVITAAQFQELRAVTDYAYDHWCTTHYSGHDSTYNSTYRSAVDLSDYSFYDSSDNSTIYSSHYSTNQSSHNSSYYGTHRAGVNITNNNTAA